MSEFLADARIIIRPDTTKFRAELLTQVAAATRTPVPVAVTPVVTGGVQNFAGLAAQAGAASVAVNQLSAAQQAAGATAAKTSKQMIEQQRTISNIERAALASAAGMTGLRGAVLTAGGAFIAATVGIQAFGRAVSSAAQLEGNLNVFRVTAGATADEMERVGETAKELGRDLSLPGVTASDAAETFLTLSRAGLSVEESLAGARGTLQLAVAAQLTFADAAQLTASALNAFSLSGDQAVAVADTLTNAANASQASIGEMGIALQQSAAIADLVGFSLSETVTFLTQLAQAGLRGSDAGTSFRVAMQRLIAPTDEARTILDRLNINLRDLQGNLRPEAFFELGQALERMGRAQGDATRQIIFGNDASRAAAFFARLNAEAFRDQERELTRAGAAAEVAGARNAGFAGSVENLKNQITALGIELGELSLPVLGRAADAAALFFGALATQIGDTREAFAGFEEDAEKLQEALTDALQDGGFIEFFQDADREVNNFLDTLDRVTGADDFVDFFTGGGDAAEETARKVRKLTEEEARLAEAIHDANRPVVEQTTNLDELAAAAARAAQSVANLQGQQRGLEEQVTRARIAEDQAAELDALRAQRAALEEELRQQEAIIARPGTAGDATAREAIRQRILPQLEAVNSEIGRILSQQRSERERQARDAQNAAEEAARAIEEADRAFLDALGKRREDADRRASAAAATEGLADDIRAQNRIQALIKQQITKVRERIRDEKLRKQAIRELRQALIDSRREEEALLREQAADRAARAQESTLLDISLAETTGNTNREIAARKRLIALLKKQQAEVKRGTIEWKRLRNEIAEQQAAIKEAQEQAAGEQGDGRSAQQFFFEQLQAQQGFAANLMGNLITGSTEGLVGVPAPSTPERQVRVSQAERQGIEGLRPTAGQANTEINVLQRILIELQKLNGTYDAPEAIHQKKVGAGNMDNFAM
jgi:TP901 family phage tail tape measure protein